MPQISVLQGTPQKILMSQKQQYNGNTSGQNIFVTPKIWYCILSGGFTVCCNIVLHSILLLIHFKKCTIEITVIHNSVIFSVIHFVNHIYIYIVHTLFGWFTLDLDVAQSYHSELFEKLAVVIPIMLCRYSNVLLY